MTISDLHPEKQSRVGKGTDTNAPSANPSRRKNKQSLSMHDGIAVWCDCCSCEAEPYWAALAEEFGVDMSDYEESASTPSK